jgi:succinate dehydrogenase / fumarate reductase flavoprotein subunit
MRVNPQKADVLIIGSGGAGLRAAIELFDNGIDVLVVGKCKKREAHTKEAQGGINAALGNMDPEDRWEMHAADTIKDGDFINDAKAVETLCREAPRAIRELEEWGVPFNRDEKGKMLQRFFGAARYRRAFFVKDVTGKAILDALVNQVVKRKIRFKPEIYITSLLHREGHVNGAMGYDLRTGAVVPFQAKLVVLATGGHSRMFKRCSSHFWENNGDGLKLAYDLGATFMDMEMFQFHPTGMVYPETMEGHLVTEAVRGEGGILTNAKGERFMDKYDPERMELSARDIVARANYMEIAAGRGTPRGGVYLDISHQPKSYLKKRLASMVQLFEKQGVDISKQKMEVAPTAHYSMGGLRVNHATGETTIPRLFAVGEVTAGVHGANRLGGNSLAEILVFGRLTGKHLVKEIKKLKTLPLDESLVQEKAEAMKMLKNSPQGKNPLQIKKELQQLMWDHVGVIRDGKQMERGFKRLKRFEGMKFKIRPQREDLMAALDVQAMLPVCEMILKTALLRKESRGSHYRSDYPKSVKTWIKNILCKPSRQKEKLHFWTEPVPPLPSSIQKYITEKKPNVHLLE